jgi:anthranilate phosphoribosyltransferase
MIKEAIAKVVTRIDLTEEEMVGVMDEIMGGRATPAQIGAFIASLRMKGETVEEITGAARVMRRKATAVDAGTGDDVLVDTCGTGGDGSGTFNVSTATAFVVAAAGVPVAKHGNRSVSSKCGSADVLEALGVDLNLPPERVGQCIREVGIGFLFAPVLHGAMKHAIGPRREIGIRTIFNVLGPLTNPAGANVQVLGVYAPELTEILAGVLGRLGSRRALVVWGEGNLDEMTVTGVTRVTEWTGHEVKSYTVQPEDVGLSRATLDEIRGCDTPAAAAAQVRQVLGGEAGPRLDMVLLNSGAALMAAGRAENLLDGIAKARQTVRSGAALAKVDALVHFCRR